VYNNSEFKENKMLQNFILCLNCITLVIDVTSAKESLIPKSLGKLPKALVQSSLLASATLVTTFSRKY